MGILRDTLDGDTQAAPATAPLDAVVSAPPIPAPPSPSPPAAPALAASPASPSQAGGRSELQRRRDALAEEVAELHWDLGGLAY
jgi:hypothetical protein